MIALLAAVADPTKPNEGLAIVLVAIGLYFVTKALKSKNLLAVVLVLGAVAFVLFSLMGAPGSRV